MFQDSFLRTNLLITLIVWSISDFDYYLIQFELAYLKGDIFENAIASGISEFSAIIMAGLVLRLLGMKIAFVFNFTISAVGGFMLVFASALYPDWTSVFVLLSKFGVSATFTLLFVITNRLFPTLFVTTAIGICSTISRVFTVSAVLVNEVKQPIPMIAFSTLTVVAAACSPFFKEIPTEAETLKEAATSSLSLESVNSFMPSASI